MTTIAIAAAAGLCLSALLAAPTDRDGAPVRLVGERCPAVAPAGAVVQRGMVDGSPLPRNVCLVFFEADDDPRG